MMTRDEFENKLELILDSDTGADCTVVFDELIAHDAEQRAVIEQQAKENKTLREALQIYKEASYQSHSGHWDMTMQHGAGCPECIRSRELRTKAEQILAQQALKEVS